MRRIGLAAGIAALVGLSLGAGNAYAQDEAESSRGLDRLKFSLGVMLGDDARARDRGDNVWLALGISYDLKRPSTTRLISLAAYFEGAAHSKSDEHDSLPTRTYNRSFYGLGISSNIRLTPPSRQFGIYGTAGVGVYNLMRNTSDSFQYYDLNNNGDSDELKDYTISSEAHNKISLGYKVGAGFRFGKHFFIETNYYNLGKLEDVRYSGIGIVLGSRI